MKFPSLEGWLCQAPLVQTIISFLKREEASGPTQCWRRVPPPRQHAGAAQLRAACSHHLRAPHSGLEPTTQD